MAPQTGGNFPEFDGKPILASSVQFSQSTLSKIMKLSKNEEEGLNQSGAVAWSNLLDFN